MEEDDEMHSPPSPSAAGSPSPSCQSPPNERISVTVAAAAPPSQQQLPQQQQQHSITVAPPPPPKNGGGGGREDCWSEAATAVLIDAWGERYLELSRGNLKQKHWKEVADIVSSREDYTKTPKTDIQCKNRIDTVKKKYKLEKAKIMSGGGASKWVFYEKLDQLIGTTAKMPVPLAIPPAITPPATVSSRVPMGIPVGIRTPMVAAVKNQHQIHLRKRSGKTGTAAAVETQSDESEEESRDSMDSFPPAKRIRVAVDLGKGRKEKGGWGESVRMLTRAILKFGEAYEQAESAKLQQVVEMEKQRMKFAKELELQRMQFLMKTQLEISQLKHGRRTVNVSNHHHRNNGNDNNNSNSDCSS
ncbi:trihelix transcription factor ASIL2-like [Mangifera indica]|uniref:trihelix transcription factor ASIL2-like n=1 Tax=Mangifera indica TaxID=29780 RepID=UPI001CFBE63F|nr:trihelix transcription factor ASIL2-like [Mangifera indica]